MFEKRGDGNSSDAGWKRNTETARANVHMGRGAMPVPVKYGAG